MKKRSEYPTVITPRSVVAWAQLNTPDYEYKAEGEFHARVRPDTSDPLYAKLVETAEALRDAHFDAVSERLTAEKKGALLRKLNKVDVVKEEIDRETGEPTGEMLIRAGMKHNITIKHGPKAGETFTKKPDFFNAQGVCLTTPPKIGSGSEVKLAVRLVPYMAPNDGSVGVSYQLEGVQILKLVSGGQRTASAYGFGVEEGDDIQNDDGGFSNEAPIDEAADF